MKKISLLFVIACVFILLPVWASAATVEGSVQGFMCVTQGTTCPVGKEDPMAAVERVFVVLTKGGEYFFVPNVDRAVMARYINKTVRVSGTLSSTYNSIQADTIQVFDKGAWKNRWSRLEEDEMRKKVHPSGVKG